MKQGEIEELVSQSVQGSKTALNRLIYHIQDDIFNLALRMLGKPEDSRDATQEILLKIVTHLSGFRGESNFRTWYYRIACNYLLNYRQKLGYNKNISFDELGSILESGLSEMSFQDEQEKRLLTEKVKTACTIGILQCLTEEARLVYVLGEILQINSVTGSKLLGMNEANFRQLLSRSRKKITSFTQSYCGIVNPNAKCSCAKAVTRAVNAGFIDLKDPTLAISRNNVDLKSKLDMLVDRTKGLFQNTPSFAAPEEIWLEVKSLLETN